MNDNDLYKVSVMLHKYSNKLSLDNPKMWLLDFASELIEAASLPQDTTAPRKLIGNLFKEWELSHELEKQEKQ